MDQEVGFCTTTDGISIAFATLGDGPPLVWCPGIYSHVDMEWRIEARRNWYERLGEFVQLIRFDKRGTGLSQRDRYEYSPDILVADLEAVVDHLGLKEFILGGMVLGGAVAILYAARHPERVSRLIIYGSGSRGTDFYSRKELAPLLSMARSNWPMAATLASSLATGVVSEEVRRADDSYVRAAIDGGTFARLLELSYSLDLRPVLPKVSAPALVLHRRGDRVIPVDIARELAALLPNSRFVALEGDSNLPFYGDSVETIEAIVDFCGLQAQRKARPSEHGLYTILFTDIEESTATTGRLGDEGAMDLLHVHNQIVRGAVNTNGGNEIKHTGDGIMASFGSTVRALECAVAIQEALAKHNSVNPNQTVRVRVGLNAGEPVAEEHDYFGTAVQLAARICDRCHPEQILVSNVVRELAAGKPFLFAEAGTVPLHGFDEPVRLFELRWRD